MDNYNMQNNGSSGKLEFLSKFATNLNERAAAGKLDPVIGRDEEIRRVLQILSRRTKNNPILVGEPGVGKTAIAEGLAQKIVDGAVPENLKDKLVYSLDNDKCNKTPCNFLKNIGSLSYTESLVACNEVTCHAVALSVLKKDCDSKQNTCDNNKTNKNSKNYVQIGRAHV